MELDELRLAADATATPDLRVVTIDEFARRAAVSAGGEPRGARRGHGRRLRLLDDVALLAEADLEWTVTGRLVAGSLALLAGPTGIGKTFVAVDCALSVVAGTEWLGASVERSGPAVYLAADGSAAGLKARIRSWKQAYGYPLDTTLGLFVLAEPVNLGQPDDVDALITAVTPLMPVMVVVDTLARTMTGLDENSARDIGVIVDAIDRIRRATRSTVLVVHHTGLGSQDRERGSSAIRAAVDTVLMLTERGGRRHLSCSKQRDAAPFAAVAIDLVSDDGCPLVRLVSAADIPAPTDPDAQCRAVHGQVTALLQAGDALSGSAIARRLHGDRARTYAELDAMRRDGVLSVSAGPRGAKLWSLAPTGGGRP